MPRTLPPVAPTQAEFVDADGYTDHEAFDYAYEQYMHSYENWWSQFGQKEHEINVAWLIREAQLERGITA